MPKLEWDVACPNCKRKFKVKAAEMVPRKTKKCPHCRAEFTFEGDDGSKVQKAVDEFEKKLRDVFKRR